MPQLSKKTIFKSPLESKKNIEAVLGETSKTERKNPLRKEKNKNESVTNTESPNSLNEPHIKDAYTNFLKKLSQSSNSKTRDEISSPFDASFTGSINILESDSLNSSLSTDVLNSQKVKEAYVEHCKKVCRSNSFDFMKNFKDTKKKAKRNNIVKKEVDAEKKETKKLNRAQTNKKNKIENPTGMKLKIELKHSTGKESEQVTKQMSPYERLTLIQESRNVGLYVLCDTCDKAR